MAEQGDVALLQAGKEVIKPIKDQGQSAAGQTKDNQTEDVTDVQNRAKALVASQPVQIIRNKPDRIAPVGTVQYPVFGPGIDVNSINIVGSSVENAGGLFRVRASATKGQMQLVL